MLTAPAVKRQAGFTLVELLVACGASIGLLIALTTLLVTVLHGTQTANARVAATRGTRLALANLENELHSACVGTGSSQNLTPIESGSNDTTLQFVSYTGTALNPTPVWHVVQFNTSTPTDTLTDTTYAVSGSPGNWTEGAKGTGTTTTLLANVSPQGSTPVFRYFAYTATAAADGEDYWSIPDGISTLPNGVTPKVDPLAVPLNTSAAATAVEVLVTLQGGPSGSSSGNATDTTVADPETDAISLRLTTPADEAPSTAANSYGPCE